MSKYGLRRAENQSLYLELTPLIDVVFLLLIFFMISTSFEQTHWLDVTLPAINEAHVEAENIPEQVTIGIDAKGHYTINEVALGAQTAKALKKYLQKINANTDTVIVIHGDAQAPHGAIVQTLDVLGQLKIQQVHIAAIADDVF